MFTTKLVSRIDLLILLSIRATPMHGYEIMQQVKTIFDGSQNIGPGTLYVSLQRLADQGLIVEVSKLRTKRRRYYELTSNGKAAIENKLNSYIQIVNWAHANL